MSEFTCRFRLSRILNFGLTVAIAMMALTLIACGGSSTSKTSSTPVIVAITPKTPTLSVNAAQTFTASVTGSSNTAVTWSVTETNGGAIDSTGKYTAAAKAGTYHVVATSQASSTASDTATITVTAPAPTFTSSAPNAASEGAPYSYPITATDPTGASDVTFTLTSGPDGATLSGSTLTWTPTSAQSRKDNAFTVTANSAAGGSNTQSWTVNPNGTIYGSQIDTYWGANGSTTKAENLSSYTFSAVVPNGDGTFTTIPGTIGTSTGTFTIPGVPAGNYWLTYNDGFGYSYNFWTNSSTFDIGEDYTGRDMSSVTCHNNTELDLNLTGLDSLATDSSNLYLAVPNQSYLYTGSSIPPNSPSSFVEPVTVPCPIDPTSGDEIYITQQEQQNGLETVVGPSLAFPGLAATPSSATDVTGTLATANPQSLDFQIQGATWAADFTNVGSGIATPDLNEVEVEVQPFVSDRYAFGSLSLAELKWNTGLTSNIDAGPVAYDNPYPSTWLTVYSGFAQAKISDDYGKDWVSNSYITTTPQSSGFAPLMSAIQNPLMNGASLFTTASSDTDTVTLSWTAPTGLSPAGYEIIYYCVDDTCPDSTQNTVYTTSTSVTLPPGLLAVGYDYEFDIGAIADSRANYNSSPYRSGYPQAYADVISAPLYINAASGAIRRQAAVAKGADAKVARTKYGSFLVTAKGSKPLDIKARMLTRFYQRSLNVPGPVVK